MARFQRGFHSAPIGMALVGLDGRFMEVNLALSKMVDCPEAQLLSSSIRDVLHVEDRERFDVAFNQLGTGELGTFRLECRLVGLADRQSWALLTAAPVEGADGHAGYVIVHAEEITLRKDAEARLVHQTLHDPLTGLPNRVLLQDRLEQSVARLDRRSESVAVFYLDVDRFKLVNDTLGHEHGDELLVVIGSRLRGVVRPADTVARVGGDEFVVLAEGLSGPDEAAGLADRIRVALGVPTRLAGTDLVPSVSIGIAIATDRHRSPEVLLRDADTAMYRAKERGKDRFEIFDEVLHVRAVKHLAIEGLIRRAIDLDQIAVAYQPIIDLTTGQVVALEALMRIDDPERGLLRPTDFLSTAEETGLIVPMDRRVLTMAVEEAARRLDAGNGTPCTIHVNLSARQLGLPGFADDIALILERNALPAPHLSLELTETNLIEATSSTIRGLNRLKELGVGLGIDDFGTGYSSLTYLRRFPVDFIKIDRTFVAGLPRNQDDVTIVKAVIGLAEALCLITIAEGVETHAQLEMLGALGCNQAQGYLLGNPEVPATPSASAATGLRPCGSAVGDL
jgi:diguanylate cyclase (GGDEF)-like protein/PAS domain S-box-containing protein